MRFRLVKESSLKSLADNIRAKAATTEPLVFPNGFEDAVESIETGITITDADTQPEDVLRGKIFYNNDGRQEGTMREIEGTTIRSSSLHQVIEGGGFLKGDIVIPAEPYLSTSSIRKGVTICGVLGEYEGEEKYWHDYWNTLMPTEDSLKQSTLAKAKIVNKKVFRPNKNIVVKQAGVFRDMNDTTYGLVDVPALCEELGITIDYSQDNIFSYMHRSNTLFERLGIVDCSNATVLNGCFQLMSNLHTIDKWIVAEGKVTDNGINAFLSCKALVNLTVEGVIDFNINLQDAKDLSGESGISVLLALKDFSGTENEFDHSAIFSAGTWERIEASEQKPPSGNSWQEYATNKKWATT